MPNYNNRDDVSITLARQLQIAHSANLLQSVVLYAGNLIERRLIGVGE